MTLTVAAVVLAAVAPASARASAVATAYTQGVTPGANPADIALGPDGSLWFTESGDPGRIGRITPSSALDGDGHTQSGTFSGGLFSVSQTSSGMTDLYLRGGGFARCGRAPKAVASATTRKRRPVRSLWGRDRSGKFRTHGRDSVATVRGTTWLTEDRCDGTLTAVKAGAVEVRERRTHRKVVVRAGHRHLARRGVR